METGNRLLAPSCLPIILDRFHLHPQVSGRFRQSGWSKRWTRVLIPISLPIFLPIVARLHPTFFPSLATVPHTEVANGVEEELAPETPWDGREGHAPAWWRVSTTRALLPCPGLRLAGPCRHAHGLMCRVARPGLHERWRFDWTGVADSTGQELPSRWGASSVAGCGCRCASSPSRRSCEASLPSLLLIPCFQSICEPRFFPLLFIPFYWYLFVCPGV
jgi:hypothetical protein